jgi:Holliday junction DNA helicase RuvB
VKATDATDIEQEDDRALRPLRLADFVGQPDVRGKLEVAVQAARQRGEPLDHVLFSGPPGLGKTTLAAIVAGELGSRFHTTSAPAISRPRDLAKLLTVLERGDILFVDEIHRLSMACEEILYPAMEDGYIDFIIGEGVTAQSIKLHLKPFTLVGATTRSGMLSSPLKGRFGIDLKLEFYAPEDLASIVSRSARLLALDFDQGAAEEVASRARMTPRVANRLVRRIRDYVTVGGVERVTREFARECLERLGVDALGLVELDRKILRLMIERYGGGPVGIKTLAALVDEEERTLEEDHEPFMLRSALIEKTPQGRTATALAYTHLGLESRLAPTGTDARERRRSTGRAAENDSDDQDLPF